MLEIAALLLVVVFVLGVLDAIGWRRELAEPPPPKLLSVEFVTDCLSSARRADPRNNVGALVALVPFDQRASVEALTREVLRRVPRQ